MVMISVCRRQFETKWQRTKQIPGEDILRVI
jgi:hypothetical protein